MKGTYKQYMIGLYKQFINKLYGENYDFSKVDSFKDFEQKINAYFGDNPNNTDVEIDITLKYKTKDGNWHERKPRAIRALVDNGMKYLPEDTERVYFEAEFVEIVAGVGSKKHDMKKKNRVAFSEKIIIVDEVDKKNVRKVMHQKIEDINKNIQAYTKQDLANFSEIISFKETKKQEDELSL